MYDPLTKHLLTCSDEKNIILWKPDATETDFSKVKEWKEHSHFVMDLKINPKEEGCFATCSLDKSIKLWN